MALPSAGPTDCSSGLSARIFNNLRYDNPWQALQSGVQVGTLCCPTVPAGIGFKCTAITTGITGASEPAWPSILGGTVVDGGVTWTAQDVANPTGKAHPPAGFFGYLLTSGDLDGYRLLAYDLAKATCDEVAADNEVWTNVAGGIGFKNSWVDLTATGFNACSYTMDFLGRVELRGCAQSGTLNSVLFTLPSKYWPLKKVAFPVDSNGAFGGVFLDAAGNVTQYAGVNTSLFLDGIRYDTR